MVDMLWRYTMYYKCGCYQLVSMFVGSVISYEHWLLVKAHLLSSVGFSETVGPQWNEIAVVQGATAAYFTLYLHKNPEWKESLVHIKLSVNK